MRAVLIWGVVLACVIVPIGVAAMSPLLEWRSPIYIMSGFAGILALGVMVIQPLAATGRLPVPAQVSARRVHRWVGVVLVSAVIVHVGGLWITSPPDVVDALTFRSATQFSVWGVLAMWAVFASAVLAVLRVRGRLRWRVWRKLHVPLAIIIVAGTIVHVVLIEGTMGQGSKIAVCAVVAGATLWALTDLRHSSRR